MRRVPCRAKVATHELSQPDILYLFSDLAYQAADSEDASDKVIALLTPHDISVDVLQEKYAKVVCAGKTDVSSGVSFRTKRLGLVRLMRASAGPAPDIRARMGRTHLYGIASRFGLCESKS